MYTTKRSLMMSVRYASIVLLSTGMLGVYFIIYNRYEEKDIVEPPIQNDIHDVKQINSENQIAYQKILEDRKILSSLLNKEKRKSGQLECAIKNEDQTKEEQVSDSGGYCQKEGSIKKRKSFTDTHLTKEISILLKGKRVGAFGDGPGLYKEYYDGTGLLEVYDAYDGAPFIEAETSGKVKFLDLSIPQYGLPIYDWVICLEVAEHIPKKYEDIFLSNLARHAENGIILSWAVPGQPGHYHVNNKPLSLVIESMKKFGFERDEKLSKFLQTRAHNGPLKNNTNVYYRKENYSINYDDA